MDRAGRETVRALGALDSTIDLAIYRSPGRFSLVAELDQAITADELSDVLAALQDRHPALGTDAADRAGPGTVVHSSGGRIPIEAVTDGTPWEYVVATEQTRPMTATTGPPARAVLVPEGPGCAVVLTVAHQALDDAYGARAVLDLVAALGGAAGPADRA